MPSSDRLVQLTEILLQYALADADLTLVIRGKEKGYRRKVNGTLTVHCDNAAAIWCYLQCFDPSIDLRAIPQSIRDGNIPVLMALSTQGARNCNYGRPMAKEEKRHIWSHGLKHCHILPLGPAELSPRQKFLRNLCPLNHFLFPSPRRYDMHRVDWSEANNTADLGESESTIALVQRRLIERVGKQGFSVYAQFLRAVGGTRLKAVSSAFGIRFLRQAEGLKPSTVRDVAQRTSNGRTPRVWFKEAGP